MNTLNSINNPNNILTYLDYDSYRLYPEKRKKNTHNGNKCITDCQIAGKTISHPMNNIKITEYRGPFCATAGWYNKEEQGIRHHDLCHFSEGDLLAWSEIDTEKFIPTPKDQCMQLLEHMHNIKNIKDAIKWSNQTLHHESMRKRILNCAWRVYNTEDPDSKSVITEIVEKYQTIALDKWSEFIYNGLNSCYPPDMKKEEVTKRIKTMLLDKFLIQMLLKTFKKINRLDWLILKFYKEDIKIHFLNELKTII